MAITPNTPNPVREDAYKTELATKLGIDPQYIPSSPVWRNEEEIAAIAEMFSNMTGGALPDDPSTDGTYALQNTVSSGTGTLSWASGGSSGGVLVVHDTDGTLNKTFKEINDASNSGCLIVVLYDDAYWYQAGPIDTENLYMAFNRLLVAVHDTSYYMPTREYVAESENDYPALDS